LFPLEAFPLLPELLLEPDEPDEDEPLRVLLDELELLELLPDPENTSLKKLPASLPLLL
jgi:hypothetical protein